MMGPAEELFHFKIHASLNESLDHGTWRNEERGQREGRGRGGNLPLHVLMEHLNTLTSPLLCFCSAL